jgi:hypothetical protein
MILLVPCSEPLSQAYDGPAHLGLQGARQLHAWHPAGMHPAAFEWHWGNIAIRSKRGSRSGWHRG